MLEIRRSTLPGTDPTKVPCVQCDRREYGLAWGDYCSLCREERQLKANRFAKRAAAVGAGLMAAWHLWKTPADLTQRLFAAASVLLVYFVAIRFVSRLMMEYLPKELRNRSVEQGSHESKEESK